MDKLVRFFVDRSLLVNLLVVYVCASGAVVAHMTTRALLPQERPQAVEVFARLPGASAIEVERLVTFRLEEALQGIESVERLISTTTNGNARIRIQMEPGFDGLTKTLEQVRSRLLAVQHRLPADLEPLQIKQEDRRNNEWLVDILVEGADATLPAHRAAIRSLIERLDRIPDVIGVRSNLQRINLYVRFDRASLDRLGIGVDDVRDRITGFFGPLAVGSIQARDQDVALTLAASFDDLVSLEELPLVVNRAGRGPRLRDVAEVEYGFAEEIEREHLNGQRFVSLQVVGALDADAVEVGRQVKSVLEEEAHHLLPGNVTARIGRDASDLIDHEINTLLVNGLGGIVLVLALLAVFLGWRVGAMAAFGLPFSYLGIILLLPLLDVNFNLISLVAMILVVGLLVDDAIIVSEEFCQRLATGKSSTRDAAVDAVREVAKPVIAMVATTIVAFLPLLIHKGNDSWLVRPLPLLITAALLLSLFESFCVLPNHLAHLGRLRTDGFRERRFIVVLTALYARLLAMALQWRYVVALLVVAFFGLAAFLLMGPVKFRGDLTMNAQAVIYVELQNPSESLEKLAEAVKPVEDVVRSLPPPLVDHVKTRLGAARTFSGKWVRGWKYAMLHVIPRGTFVQQEERRLAVEEMVRDKLKALEGDTYRRVQFVEDVGPERRDVVGVFVSGSDRIDFTEIQDAIRTAVKDVDNVKDVFIDDSRLQRMFRFVVDERAVLSYGLTRQGVQQQLRQYFSRHELLRMRQRGEEIDVFLSPKTKPRPSRQVLDNVTVMTGQGVAVPARYLGEWRQTQVLRRIKHRDVLRLFQIDVLYDPETINAEQISAAIEAKLAPVRARYPGYYISVKPSESLAKAKDWLLHLVLLCIGFIYLFLALSLGSLIQPIVIVFAIPYGFAGVVLAFYVHGLDLSVMAVIGVLGLAGVVVNDSLVMVATINKARKKQPEAGQRAAVHEGSVRRFRAVVLTSLTTLAGVLPLAYGFLGDAGWLRPMVLALGWGLVFATLLTLFFIPSLLLIIEDMRRALRWVFRPARRSRLTESP